MKSREEQIQGKMEEVHRQQEESMERRERLLQEMELVSELTRHEQHETEARKASQKQQLEAQVIFPSTRLTTLPMLAELCGHCVLSSVFVIN